MGLTLLRNRLAVDNIRLSEGAQRMGLALSEGAVGQLCRLGDELLRWNKKVNLTAITEEGDVIEKHFLDSLAVASEVGAADSLLDLGSGAGFPALPLAIALPSLQATLVDAVAKKVGFSKHVIAQLGLAPRVKALHQRAAGNPEREGLPLSSCVVARALMDLGPWLKLASAYLRPGGQVLAMVARLPEALPQLATAAGLSVVATRSYRLPFSNDPRAVAVFRALP